MSESMPEASTTNCNARREFLTQTAITAGGLVLALALGAEADVPAGQPGLVLKLSDHPKLAAVGGSEVIELANGKVIVAHNTANSFVAVSAICTHRGCTVDYDADKQQFACPCHGARYDLDGSVLQGPARHSLDSYKTDEAISVAVPAEG